MLLKARTSAPVRPWVVPVAAGGVALALGRLTPLLSPLLLALALGVAVGNTPLHRRLRGHEDATKLLLRVGVVLLGLRLPLQDLVAVGLPGLAVIALTVVATYTLTCVIGDRLGLERGLVTLVASGFSICGAAAIAAIETGIRRRDEDVAVAIAMVTIFGTAMIVALPVTSRLLGLTDQQLGVWAGASIHEVAQVVAAASTAGAVAVAAAATIKLGRVALLAVAYAAGRRRDRSGVDAATEPGPTVPWFVIGFVVAVLVRTTGVLPEAALNGLDLLTTLLLAAAMFGLGLGVRVATLFPVPARVLGLSAASTGIAASVSLAATVAFF